MSEQSEIWMIGRWPFGSPRLTEMMADGWQPFAVTQILSGLPGVPPQEIVWCRKRARE